MNTQINEDLVSFEVAKLLEEKGFNWEWSPFYSEQDRDEWARKNNYNIPNPNYDANIPFDSETLNVIAPHVSLQMAMKWLREVHKINISIMHFIGFWMFGIDINDIPKTIKMVEYDKYEETCEEAIKYCLTNLI